jgi:hypothetical protein
MPRRAHSIRTAGTTRPPRPRRWAVAVAVLVDLQDGWLDNPGFPISPVDLPLRVDDAGASPTTPQGPRQQVIQIKKEKELRRGLGRSAMRQREHI